MKNHAKTICGVVIEKDGEYSLVQHGKEPYNGKWGLPGGHVELQESLEKSIKRETLEETGYEIRLTGISGIYTNNTPKGNWITDIIYLGKIIGGECRKEFDDEIINIGFFSYFEIEKMKLEDKLRFSDIIEIIEDSRTRIPVPLSFHRITK